MGYLEVDKIQPGMRLASDVLEQNGRVLLRAGAEVTERYLTVFRTWGVTGADIQGVENESQECSSELGLDPGLLQEAEAYIKELFCHADEAHPFIQELQRACALRKARQNSRRGL